MQDSSTGLRIKGLTLAHPDRSGRVLLRVESLDLKPGQWMALVGANGAGKSSLLRHVAVDRPVGVTLQGRSLTDWPASGRARRMAWLPQGGTGGLFGAGVGSGSGGLALGGSLTVKQVALLGRAPWIGLLGSPGSQDHAAVAQALSEAGLESLADRPVASLSGGEQQRALIARLLATQAPVMLLDEPFAHLDLPHQRQVLLALRRRCAAGACALSVVHDLNLALSADAIVIVHEGHALPSRSAGDPSLHEDLRKTFGGAIEVLAHPEGNRWIALPLTAP